MAEKRDQFLFAEQGEYNCGFCTAIANSMKPCDKCLLPRLSENIHSIADSLHEIAANLQR